MPDQPEFDVRKAIEASSSRSTLQELARRGIQRVKVLDEKMIHQLIGEAVNRMISTKTNLLSDDERAHLIEASRKELDRLMSEQRSMKDRTELVERDKNALVAEVENLQKQIQMQRKLGEETARQRYEDGRAASRPEIEDLQRKLASQEEDVSRRVRREIELEFQAKSAAGNATLEQMKADLGRREEEIRGQYERREHDLRGELGRRENEILGQYERRERDLREELARREKDMEMRGASAKEAELRTHMDEMNAKNMEMAQKHAQLLEDMKKSDEELFKKMTELFTKSIESLSKKLTDLRLRSFAGGGSLGGRGGGEIELHAGALTIENLFSQELDSNLKSMQVEEKTGGKLGGALDRLKALRGGPSKAPEKKPDNP